MTDNASQTHDIPTPAQPAAAETPIATNSLAAPAAGAAATEISEPGHSNGGEAATDAAGESQAEGVDAETNADNAESGDEAGADKPGRRRRARRGGARGDKAVGDAPANANANADADADGNGGAATAAAGRAAAPAVRSPRPQREVHPALEKLFGLYPRMFGARFLPLKLGVYQDLLAAHPDVFRKDELKVALGLHARSTRYLESVAAGLPRHDLQAQPVEPVSPEHVHHAILEVFRRRQQRAGAKDLQPQLVAQIVAAIETSGLAPEDYALAVRTPDEAASAALDEAIAEFKRVAAKSTALVRAFDASGKSLAEFAEMYGMRYDEVSDAVAKVRKLQATA